MKILKGRVYKLSNGSLVKCLGTKKENGHMVRYWKSVRN